MPRIGSFKRANLNDSLIETELVIRSLAQFFNELGTGDDNMPAEELWDLECSSFILNEQSSKLDLRLL